MNATLSSSPRRSPGLPASIREMLAAVSRRQLLIALADFPVLAAALFPLLWMVRGLIDRFFGLSWTVRCLLLIGDILLLGGLAWFFVVLPLRRRLTPRAAALLVERKNPRFRTSLIAAVDLTDNPDGSPALIRDLLEEVGRNVNTGEVVRASVSTAPLRRNLKIAALSLGIAGLTFGLLHPNSFLLLQRVWLSRMALPTHTIVVPLTRDATIPEGSDFTLSARAEGVVPRGGRVILVQADGRRQVVPATSSSTEPEVFTVSLKNVRQDVTYRFALNDGVGEEYRVSPRALPSLSSVRFTQVYPSYTGLAEAEMSPGGLVLLAGGKLRIQGESSQPLQAAELEMTGSGSRMALPVSGTDRRLIAYELAIPEEGLEGFALHLKNTAGESSVNDPVYRVDVRQDRPPVVALTAPKAGKLTVLMGAGIPVAYSIRDDFGIENAAIVYQVFRPGVDGESVPAETGRFPLSAKSTSHKDSLVWDLGRLVPELGVGCSMTFWIEATDAKKLTGKSREKVIHVVSEEAKKAELLEAREEMAGAIERLYKIQRSLNEKTDTSIRSNP